MKPFVWLCQSLTLLSTVHAVAGLSPDPTGRHIDSCAIRASVRAPDLDPGKILAGQVRIRVKGPCDPVVEYSLILRFQERILAKTLKPGAELPEIPFQDLPDDNLKVERRAAVSGRPPSSISKDPSLQVWQEYMEAMHDPTFWTVVEEERVAFESSYKLYQGSLPGDRIIRDFTLLVPTTNYPPSQVGIDHSVDLTGKPTSGREHRHSYLYSVQAEFFNGTTIEVPAGYSSFNTLNPNPQAQENAPEVLTFRAHFTERDIQSSKTPSNPINLAFNVNVTLPHGRNLEQGTSHNLTFTLWSDSGAIADNYTMILSPPAIALRMTSQERQMQKLFPGKNISIPSPSYTPHPQLSRAKAKQTLSVPLREKRKRGENWNTTTSQAIDVPWAAFPSFDMHYQSLQAHLHITLNIASCGWNGDGTFDEDYNWTPATRQLRQRFMPFNVDIPITVSPNAKEDFYTTHYLSPDARQPVFIDPSAAHKLMELSVEERDLLAPKSTPIIRNVTDDVVPERFYQSSLNYVADIWQRNFQGGVESPVSEEGGIEASRLMVELVD